MKPSQNLYPDKDNDELDYLLIEVNNCFTMWNLRKRPVYKMQLRVMQ